jgi:hypothetical protein
VEEVRVSKKPPRCDSCNRRIRRSQHELRLSDLLTGQLLGRYHAACQAAAAKYFRPGVLLRATIAHPDRCGDRQEFCDGGLREPEPRLA